MKLSDLPLRDQIALEVLPGIISAGCTHPSSAVSLACETADIMIAQIKDYRCRIKEAEKLAAESETRLNIMRQYKFEGPDFVARIALSQIWDMLDVTDQTAAVTKLKNILACDRCGSKPIRDTLDGNNLCQSCCNAWAKGEYS